MDVVYPVFPEYHKRLKKLSVHKKMKSLNVAFVFISILSISVGYVLFVRGGLSSTVQKIVTDLFVLGLNVLFMASVYLLLVISRFISREVETNPSYGKKTKKKVKKRKSRKS